MIIDKLENADRYAPLQPGFTAAFHLLRDSIESFAQAETGAREEDGPRLTVNVIRAPARTPDQVRLEAHREHIDIQYLVAGDESFGWKLTSECVAPEGEYDEEKDVIKFADEPEAWFPLTPGTFVVFFPEDAHGPMRGEGQLEKLVVKVAIEWDQNA